MFGAILGPKNCWSKKFGTKNFGPAKMLVQQNFGQKNFGFEKFWVQNKKSKQILLIFI